MEATDLPTTWMVPVPSTVQALNLADAMSLVKGSSFARRVKATDPEHGSRLCSHGRLLFQSCTFCAAGLPAVCEPTFAEQRESARTWLVRQARPGAVQ